MNHLRARTLQPGSSDEGTTIVTEDVFSEDHALRVKLHAPDPVNVTLTPKGLQVIEYTGPAIGAAQVLGVPLGASKLWRVDVLAITAASSYIGIWDQVAAPALNDMWRRQVTGANFVQQFLDWTNQGGLDLVTVGGRFWIGASITAPLYTAVVAARWSFNAWYT